MHAELMSAGLDQGTADAVIGKFPHHVVVAILRLLTITGAYAKQAMLLALPYMLKGDWVGAIDEAITYLAGLIPEPMVGASILGSATPSSPEAPPSAPAVEALKEVEAVIPQAKRKR